MYIALYNIYAKKVTETSIKKLLQKIEEIVKSSKKKIKDGNKGQGSSLLLYKMNNNYYLLTSFADYIIWGS